MDKLLDVYSSYEPQDKERLGEFVSSARKLLAATLAAESDYDGAIDLMGGEVRENPSAQAYFELAHLCLAASWRTDDTSARARRERQALWSFKQVLDMHPPGEMADEARKWVNELSLVRNRVGCLSPVDQTGSEAYSARIIQALRLPVCVANGYEFVGRLSAGDITQAFYEAETHRMAWILETLAKSLEITESKVEGKPAATARLVVGLVLYDVEEREQVAATELTFYSDPPGTDPLRENRLRKAVQILLKTVQQELPERASRFVAQNVKPSTDPSR